MEKTIEFVKYIKLNYEYFFKYEILKAETLSSKLTKVLNK
ncbi:hypothetical protein BBU118A_S02 (plasmid) [Borreliella burgdorferi 118a]|uniref:Uncharacterized protein n=1 Tax=Borreliella burgdorferi 118a TaxID=476210 RepID=A0A7U3YB13_BORBG|nr:hypothetical protein BBU118A_S02 [Borreliella burgdorferi 118a]